MAYDYGISIDTSDLTATVAEGYKNVMNISGSQFQGGKNYLLLMSGLLTGDTESNGSAQIQVRHGGVDFPSSFISLTPPYSVTNYRRYWSWVTRFTQPSTPESISIHLRRVQETSARVRCLSFFWINLDQIEDGYEYSERTTPIGPFSASTSLTSITFTPPSTGDYLVIGSARHTLETDGFTASTRCWLDLDSGSQTTPEYSLKMDSFNDINVQALCRVYNLSASSHTIDLRAMRSGATELTVVTHAQLIVIPMSAFNDYASYYNGAEYTHALPSTFEAITDTLTINPQESSDFIFIGQSSFDSNTSSTTAEIRLKSNSVVVPTNIDAHSGVFNGSAAEAEDQLFILGSDSYSPGSNTLSLEASVSTVTGKMQSRSLVALSMATITRVVEAQASVSLEFDFLARPAAKTIQSIDNSFDLDNVLSNLRQIKGLGRAQMTGEGLWISADLQPVFPGSFNSFAFDIGMEPTFEPTIYTTDRASGDMRVTVSIDNTGIGGFGLIFRYEDVLNYWMVYLSESNQYVLQKKIAGVLSDVREVDGAENDNFITVDAYGSLISVYVNNRLSISTTSTDLQNANKCGILISSSNVDTRIRRFRAWNIVSPTIDLAQSYGHIFYNGPEVWL